MLLSLDRVDYC